MKKQKIGKTHKELFSHRNGYCNCNKLSEEEANIMENEKGLSS